MIRNRKLSENNSALVHQLRAGILPGAFPIGAIIMWTGAFTNNSTIPGWYKCDGNNGTVNLVGKFVRGAAASGGTGGADTHTLALAEMPTHNHTATVGNQSASHQHSIQLHNHSGYSGSNPEGGTHATHSGTHNTGNQNASHNHTVTIGNKGSSNAHNNMPSYHELIYIQRIS